eukprot:TRINITY_DN31081_c0_g1_i1.p1 TRINITY_DN31081_c0_g1~~TRINITY_DN31081_c0_g1_i1.p1  ORF type:complete len:380 (-),score=49.10 TRINITY_DN31081_c0_g1_i1:199-1338(-)
MVDETPPLLQEVHPLLTPPIMALVLTLVGEQEQQYLFFGGVAKGWRKEYAQDRRTAHAEAAKYPKRLQWAWEFRKTESMCRAYGRYAHWVNADDVKRMDRDIVRIPRGRHAVLEGAMIGDNVTLLTLFMESQLMQWPYAIIPRLTMLAVENGALNAARWGEQHSPAGYRWEHVDNALAAVKLSNLRLWEWHSERMDIFEFNFSEAVAVAVISDSDAILRSIFALIPDRRDLNLFAGDMDEMLEQVVTFAEMSHPLQTTDTCVFAHATWPHVFTADVIADITAGNGSVAISSLPPCKQHFQQAFEEASMTRIRVIGSAAADPDYLEWVFRQSIGDWSPGSRDVKSFLLMLYPDTAANALLVLDSYHPGVAELVREHFNLE